MDKPAPDAGRPRPESGDSAVFWSPRDLASRWRCSRSSAQRLAEAGGLTKIYLGRGRNGMVRYLREEVEAYEESRRAASNDAAHGTP